MKNIHNIVSDLMHIIDTQHVMTTHIDHQQNGYISIHIYHGHRHLHIEVFEGSDRYTDVGLIS